VCVAGKPGLSWLAERRSEGGSEVGAQYPETLCCGSRGSFFASFKAFGDGRRYLLTKGHHRHFFLYTTGTILQEVTTLIAGQ